MKIDVNDPCCVCSSHNSRLLFETQYPNHGYPGMFRVRKCQSCGLLFNSPRLNDEDLFKLYGRNYYFFKRKDADELKRVANIYLRTIALIKGEIKHKKILEIGSAKGYLLALLKRLDWDVQGIELSEEASQYAESKFDVSTFNGPIDEFVKSDPKEKFPYILAIDVLEHVSEPIKFIHCIDLILEDGGVLIIDTPNARAKNIEVAGSEWKGFNPFHIYLFSIDNLRSILKDMGYSVETTFSYGNVLLEGQLIDEDIDSDNRRVSLKGVLKQTVRNILIKINLLSISKKLYSKIQSYSYMKGAHSESLFTSALKIAVESPLYSKSEDAHAELSQDFQGDNIVIIARKCI